MKYISTRGEAPVLNFEEVTLTGLARDGGLYLPETWPTFSLDEMRAMRGMSYPDLVVTVLKPFMDDWLSDDVLKQMADRAYANFSHAADSTD